jgi:VanZ family protein
MNRQARQYLPAILLAVVIFATSLFPVPAGASERLPTLFGVALDKWVHAVSYGALTGLLAWSRQSRAVPVVFGLAALAIGYGACVELLQGLVPSRGTSGADMVANAAGALCVAVVWLVIHRQAATAGPRD